MIDLLHLLKEPGENKRRLWNGPELAVVLTSWLDSSSMMLGTCRTHLYHEMAIPGTFLACHCIEYALKGLTDREDRSFKNKHCLGELWEGLRGTDIHEELERDYPVIPLLMNNFDGANIDSRYVGDKNQRESIEGKILKYADVEPLLLVSLALTAMVWRKCLEDWPGKTAQTWQDVKKYSEAPLWGGGPEGKRTIEMGTYVHIVSKHSFCFDYAWIDPMKEKMLIPSLEDPTLFQESLEQILIGVARSFQNVVC